MIASVRRCSVSGQCISRLIHSSSSGPLVVNPAYRNLLTISACHSLLLLMVRKTAQSSLAEKIKLPSLRERKFLEESQHVFP